MTDEPGFVYVMLDRGQGSGGGDVVKARARIRPVAGWAVLVGSTRERPWEYFVLDVDTEAMGGELDGVPILEPHAETHQWGNPDGGDDITRPRFLQLYDFGVWPADGLAVNVMSGIYNPSGTKQRLTVTNVDLSGTKPTTGQRYTLVCLSPTGTFELVPGTIKNFLTVDDIPAAPSNDHWELAAVKIRSTDDEITFTPAQPDIVDLRFARVGWPHKKCDCSTGTSTVDTRANILASSPGGVRIAFASDTEELLLYDGSNWRVAPLELNTISSNPDMGAYTPDGLGISDKAGYYDSAITNKALANCTIAGTAPDEEGAIRVVSGTFQIYANGVWNDVVINFVFREDSDGNYELEHQPIGLNWYYEVVSGNSNYTDVNGRPFVRQYRADMGAYVTSNLIIDCGSF